jgi:tryptophan-rich sensory protein
MPDQSEHANPSRRGAAWALLGWLVLCFAVATLSSFSSVGNISGWYASLAKPRLVPVDWVFASVWTVLYVLMAVAAWLVWRTRPSNCRLRGLRLFFVQLWFNLLWSWIFFNRHQIGIALIDLAVLWVAIVLTTFNFRKVSAAAMWLMLPYLVWVTFAVYLNFALWRKN